MAAFKMLMRENCVRASCCRHTYIKEYESLFIRDPPILLFSFIIKYQQVEIVARI